MTLDQLKKTNAQAYAAWLKHSTLTPELHFITTRAYKSGNGLFIVWNNGCFYEPFRYENGEWNSIAARDHKGRGARSKYYAQACKTLGKLDRDRLYG